MLVITFKFYSVKNVCVCSKFHHTLHCLFSKSQVILPYHSIVTVCVGAVPVMKKYLMGRIFVWLVN